MDTCCFCKMARPAILTWSYIKMIFMLLATFPLYIVLVMTIFYGEQYEMILFWAILITYPTAFGFNITLIVAAHRQIVKTLKVCLYYLIIELIVITILSPWALRTVITEYDLPFWVTIVTSTTLIIAQGVFSIIMVNSEVRKLSDSNGVPHEEVGYSTMKDLKETN